MNLAVWILNTENQHMLREPSFFISQIRRYTKSKALFTQKNISAITGVNGHNRIVFRKLHYITIFLVKILLRVKSFNKIRIITESVKNFLTGSRHYKHIKHNIDRICKLNSDFSEIRTHNAHRIRNYIHCLSFHRPVVKFI